MDKSTRHYDISELITLQKTATAYCTTLVPNPTSRHESITGPEH